MSAKTYRYKVNCPYCGKETTVRSRSSSIKKEVWCDVFEGGCARNFFVEGQVQVVINCKALKDEEMVGGGAVYKEGAA